MSNLTRNNNAGFTLFEVIIYIALFTFIIGGAIMSAYQIFSGSQQIRGMAERETEINFMLRKIDWALNSTEAADIHIPNPSELIVDKGADQYTLKVDADALVIKKNSGSFLPITNDFIGVESVTFQRDGATPETVTATLVVDGESIETKHYVRQN